MITLNVKSTIFKYLSAILLIVILSFAVYANTLDGDFVWDDTTLFIQNFDLWQWSNLKQLLTCQDNLFGNNNNAFYRPLPNLTFLLDRYIWGHNPFGYHLTNIIFHILSAVTLFLIAKTLSGNFYTGLATGLLFAAHPIHTEVVAWINGRNNVISTFFYLLSFYFYIRYRNNHNFKLLTCSLVSYACCLFSKEYALTFPIVMFLYEISYSQEKPFTKKGFTKIGVLCLPYFLLIGIYALVRSLVLPMHGAINLQLETLWARLLTVPKLILIYLKLLALPTDLSIFHDVSLVEHPHQVEFLFQIMILAAFLFIWGWSAKKSKTVFFGFGWILITLLPVLNVAPLSYVISFLAERYLYLPSVGFCMIVASFLTHIHHIDQVKKAKILRYAHIFLLLIITEVYAFETAKRNLVWKNELTLWADTVSKSPDSFQARCNLSIAFHAAGRVEEALSEIREAVRLNPENDTVQFILGQILYDKGLFEQSSNALKKALKANPNHTDALNLLTSIHFKTGRIEQ